MITFEEWKIKTIYNYVFSLVISKIIIYFECPI
jgi:hypothetical protein